MKHFIKYLFLVPLVVFAGCTGRPTGVEPVREFELNKYLGKWYEIARLDHRFERGLEQVSAEYTLRDDGGVRVVNKGYKTDAGEWTEIEGKAYFVGPEDEGHLKVSFFGPLYASYVVFELDKEDYQYAFVAGNTTSYLWLLSRTPEVSDELLARFRARATELGFDAEALILVPQK
ncbi:MAG: lipocalin family protein [Betaproteobacteria bacterium]|nr:MAG: lipocalin family protein [Betaproteobacteria bacterium]